MKQQWLHSARALAAVLLVFFTLDVKALEDFNKLCPHGNVSIISSANAKTLVQSDRCFPIPVINRNELGYKPKVMVSTATRAPFRYTAIMFDVNTTSDKYDVYWMQPNLTITTSHYLEPNNSFPRDIRKMIEYRPPKSSPLNVTYVILVYRQSNLIPVESPPRMPFRPHSWVTTSGLSLIGGAKFIVRATNLTAHHPPAHHHPLPSPPAVIPGGRAPPHPHQHPPNMNVAQQNYTYYRNYTNHTNYHPPYHPQPAHPPNQFYPPNNYIPPKKGKKGAAVDLQAASALIIFMASMSFVLNL